MKMKSLLKKKFYKLLLLSCLGIFSILGVSGQQAASVKVTGTVIEESTSEPVIGARVFIKGTAQGTATDVDGNFELSVPSNGTLVVSFVGYKVVEQAIGSQRHFNIAMEDDVKFLDEVVVIGYGQVKKGDATGSLTSITPDELNKGMQVKAQDALVGKIAGVNIVPGSGAPGDGGTIRIRMGASLSATNDPLIVIDGIPVMNTSINSINPNDIATFTVLKDASATAIYGSRASNGVIIITTKKGNEGDSKPRVNYSSNFSLSTVPEYLKVLSTEQFRSEFKAHSGAPDSFELGTASTDWQKEIYRTAFGTDHNLSVTGVTLKVPYRISAGYTKQNGIVKENAYERFNASVGFSPKFFDKHLSLDVNIKGSIENDNPVSTGVIGTAATFDPTRPIYMEGRELPYFMWLNKGTPISIAPSNPVADLKLTDKLNKTSRSIGNAALNYKVHGFEDLVLSANLGYDVYNIKMNENIPQFAPSMYVGHLKDGTALDSKNKDQFRNYLIDLYANYSKDLGEKHNISAMAGYGWQRFLSKSNGSKNDKDADGKVYYKETHSDKELYLLSFFGRLNYTYAQKLMLTATLRADASSRFAKDNRWGYFPSVALAYRLNEEAFLKEFKPLSDLKLRLSYGQTGQQDIGGYYQHLSKYTASYNDSRYQFGDEWITTYRPDGYDPSIKWETTSTYNFGLDYGFLNNRVYGSVDFYTRKTKDLLNEIYVPAGSNFSNIINTNIGDMKSKGLELGLTVVPITNRDWEWSISGNFTWNSSEITKLNRIDSEDTYVKTGNAGGTGKYLQVHKVGETPNTFFLLQQAYDDNGKPLDGKYVAKDGSITTSEEDANKYITGKSSRSPYYYGLSSKVTYKQWDFGINGHGSFGGYVYNYQAAGDSYKSFYGDTGVSSNIMKSTVKSGFTQERLFTDYFLEKANFFKLDNITLGYSFNKLWNTKSSLRLAFAVQNVFTITSYSGLDPEIYSGIDKNVYQRPRTYMMSLNLNF